MSDHWKAGVMCRSLLLLVFLNNPYLALSVTGGDIDAVDTLTRAKRSCDASKVLTMDRFINIIEHIENHVDVKDKSAKAVSNYMRTIFNDRFFWEYFCFQLDDDIPTTVLNATQIHDLKWSFITHSDKTVNGREIETGVALTSQGDTVSAGHMAVGVSCGGFARDSDMELTGILTSYKLDNLHVVTLGGDLGQTTMSFHNNNDPDKTLVGPGGQWDSTSCPMEYTLDRKPSESTKAEILGDIDGIILGAIIPDIEDENLKLSEILRRYYGGSGLGPGGIFKDSNRILNYKMLVQDNFMNQQAIAFLEAYSVLLNVKDPFEVLAQRRLKAKVPSTLKQFYSLSYINVCNDSLREKYTMKHFIEIVKLMEEKTGYDVEKMSSQILGLIREKDLKQYFDEYLDIDDDHKHTDGFYWQVLTDLVTHKVLNDGLISKAKVRELGTLKDFHQSTVAIGNVLAGILAGKNNGFFGNVLTTAENLYGATVSGVMARAVMKEEQLQRRKGLIGPPGVWTTECPPKYLLSGTTTHVASIAEITGAIDGFILGKQNSDLKLSEILEQYYTTGLTADHSVKSTGRIDQFKKIYGGKGRMQSEILKTCVDLSSFWKPALFSYISCSKLANGAATEFEYRILSEVEARPKSGVLPDYDRLQKAYKGYLGQGGEISGDDIKSEIGGGATSTSITNTDALRISLALNQLGDDIDPETASGSGTIKGKHGKTYIHDVSKLESYLSGRYGTPFIAVSANNLAGKRGVLVVDTKMSGKVTGLWNGEKMHQMINFAASPVNEMLLWQSADCGWLADSSDCTFYTCVENQILTCGAQGYAIGYAHRYCNKFVDNLSLFTPDGKKWVQNVKSCLMEKLLPLVRNIRLQSTGSQANCENLKQIAFKSHPTCYTDGEPNFCDIILNPLNWVGLLAVFETGDFFGVDGKLAMDQLTETAATCQTGYKNALEEALQQLQIKLHPSNPVYASSDVTGDCERYASQGDCRFYECFEKRFPCHDQHGYSHIRDFELISCKKFNVKKSMMDSAGELWMVTSQVCMMQQLLGLYRGTTVNCAEINHLMMDKRSDCFFDSGFCRVLESAQDKFVLDVSMNTRGFPLTMSPDAITTSPVLDSSIINLGSYYYQSTISMQRMIGPLATLCYNDGQRDTPDLYVKIQSDQCPAESCTLKMDATVIGD